MPFDAQAVFFDAGATLLLPTVPIPEVYLREARVVVGDDAPPRDAFEERLACCWTELRDTPVTTGEDLQTDEDRERAMWDGFTAAVAEPFPALAGSQPVWLERLVTWFDSAAAWAPAPGAVDLLGRLRSEGRSVGVVSNWHNALHGILDGLDLRRLLDFVIVSSEHGWRKPHRSIFEAALAAARVDADQAVHIGDAPRDDVAGALALGIRPILVAPTSPESVPDHVRRVTVLGDLLSDCPPSGITETSSDPEFSL